MTPLKNERTIPGSLPISAQDEKISSSTKKKWTRRHQRAARLVPDHVQFLMRFLLPILGPNGVEYQQSCPHRHGHRIRALVSSTVPETDKRLSRKTEPSTETDAPKIDVSANKKRQRQRSRECSELVERHELTAKIQLTLRQLQTELPEAQMSLRWRMLIHKLQLKRQHHHP